MHIEQSDYTFSQTLDFPFLEKISINEISNKIKTGEYVDDYTKLLNLNDF
jgi:hypothetical protein